MRHHPKSNQGRFSKKQKKSSRSIMAMRKAFVPRDSGFNPNLEMGKAGILANLATLMGLRRKAS